ncbi:MAG: hypothetical protein COY66_03400 [Candidatus Kerfeldbacteria bacterium CG_4_10_14_0_8_um_filter_42_10]|uniref:Uncharacterized protein n=1 Tax=Candidatus Kerfeldbacteria bacterium CG_4_10_14_0_8_um_filter_42_10 TaxID=2014248 RepID=A0A2M7RJR4_9BACT|nr:MAG: hypothetical protein COY66_03400 [Candidatus Kerfeldbacteria bacterium CG_4_10_14_0_8_um_filter_42_10]
MAGYLGYPCRITYDGHKYTVSDAAGNNPPQTFYSIQVGFRAQLTANPDKTDPGCYCQSTNMVLNLTMPEATCRQIRESTFPKTVPQAVPSD